MINKNIMLIAVFLVSLLALSAVSANEDVSAQTLGQANDCLVSMDGGDDDDWDDEDWEDEDWEDEDWEDDDDDGKWVDDWLKPEENMNDIFFEDEYSGINAKIEYLSLPKDFTDRTVKLRLYNINNNQSLGNVDLGIYTTYDWEYTKITTDSNGIATYKVPFDYGAAGVLAAMWKEDEAGTGVSTMSMDNRMHCVFAKDIINISTIEANLRIVQEDTYYGCSVLNVYLTTMQNKPIKEANVKITFSNGKKEVLTTDSKGEATYPIDFAPGTFTATASVMTKSISSNPASLTIKIVKAPASLTASKLTTTYASGKYFQIKLINSKNNRPIRNAKVALKIYTGKKYTTKTVTTDSSGAAKYLTSALSVGTHKVIVSVKDSKCISAKSKTTSIKITKASYKIAAPKFMTSYRTGTYKVTVKNKASGAVLKNVKVTMKVYTGSKYKTFTVKTDANGIASISTKSLSKANHKVVISIQSSGNYNSASVKSTISIVNKIGTYLERGLNEDGTNTGYFYTANGGFGGVYITMQLFDINGNELKRKVTAQMWNVDFYGDHSLGGSQTTAMTGTQMYVYKNSFTATGRSVIVTFPGDDLYKASTYEFSV